MSLVLIGFGVTDIFVGSAADPGIPLGLVGLSPEALRAESQAGYQLLDFFTRSQGLALLAFGLLATTILLVAYRADQRWAWWTLWSLPAWSAGVFALYLVAGVDASQPPPPPMATAPFFTVLAAAAQVVSAPRFFRR